MPLADLLRLAELSLAGPPSLQFTEDLLRAVVEETGSRAGVLRRDGVVVARWPRTVSPQVEDATEGWTEVQLSSRERQWTLRLLQAGRVDDAVLGVLRLSLQAWQLQEQVKKTRFEERFHIWELEAIRSVANTIGGILEESRIADELLNHLVALLGVRSAHLFLGDDPTGARNVSGFGALPIDDRQLEQAWHHGIYSDELVALPLTSDNGTLGLLVAADKEARAGTEPFAANDIRLLELFAIQVTLAMEFARLTRESLERERLRRELEVAAEIQSFLFPRRFPDYEGFRLAARSSPSRQVAGDTYDVLLEDGRLAVVVADVSGKGVGAGMIASGIHAAVRLLAPTADRLDCLAADINCYLSGATEDNRFATFAMIRLQSDGALAAVNAGHCPVLVRRRDGRVERISSSGLPLGILSGASYSEVPARLEPGDLVLLYTDGLTEAENPDEQEFGVDRVEQVVAGLETVTAEAACRELLHAVERFTCGRPLTDDATLVVVERLADNG